MKRYLVKRGAADPFRGDWYILEEEFHEMGKAIEKAAALTINNFLQLKTSWEEYGYEWSVFEKSDQHEIKIWEGYKYIHEMKREDEPGHFDLGLVN